MASRRTFDIEKEGSTTGDLIIEVQISGPDLTEDQKKMMEEFAEAGGMKY